MYTYNNLAVAYGRSENNKKENAEKALMYSKKGIEVALKYDNIFVAGVIEGGVCHILNKVERYNEAITYCQRSIQHLEAAKRNTNLVFPLINIATSYNALNKHAEALKYDEKGYAIMVEKKIINPMEVYYEKIAKANEKQSNYKESLE